MAAKTAVDTLREKLQAGDRGGSPADRELLLAFSDELKLRREDYGWHRHEKLLRHNTRASEHAGVELVESILSERDDDDFDAAKDAAKEVVRWIHDTYDIAEGSQETNRDYRVAFRMLAKHTTRGEEIPDTHDWISTQTTRDYQPEPDEADMLEWDAHVRPMIDACHNDRDRALIALQFEGGFRGGELHDLTLDQISDSEHSVKVRVDGKRGEHDVHLIRSIPWVSRWQSEHPGGGDDYVWSRLNKPERVSYQLFLKIFRKAAGRADVDLPVTPTNFRKSNAYWLSQQDKSQAFIEDRQGRARGSPVISRYVAKFSGETQEAKFAAMHGIDVDLDEDDEVRAPVVCHRCDRETPAENDLCMWCGTALDAETAKRVDELEDEMVEDAVDAARSDLDVEAEDVIAARDRLRDDPILSQLLLD
ncbi:phage integrase [Halorubrum aidingense JCM 13560]|uniref:Phage integrase n=1 Tax=Halorubrum aidingense JCM 13560 TaxID=1230454 RepID=M0PK95_9EURY|nr:tyrosine-type recombinase/integrase [Halorubrum aidingense]EMA69170.1 phage integrase [Halorubrum aidingense JCM 13560]